MKSNSKLDAVVGLDSEGSDFSSLNGKVIIGERANVVHKILNGFQRLGNRSIHNMSKDAEHRVESDR